MSDDFTEDGLIDSYWEQEARNERDEYEQHEDHVYEVERERLDDHGS